MAAKLGEYIIEKPLGRGAIGQVYLARQESLDRLVAVKVLPRELATDANFRARFAREAKAAAALIHPNVVQIYSFGIERDVPYFAMEYVEGDDLGARLKRGEKFDLSEVVRIIKGVASALECAQEQGMIHRDIKPSNVMIGHKGAVKVMDFGLARATSVQSQLTQQGLIMGTPTYMSPEQGKGLKDIDVRADLYSLGVVLYKLLTGEVPFTADTPTAVIFRHIYEPPEPVRKINPQVPEALESIVHKLLQKNPDDRYGSPSGLIKALEDFETGVTAAPTRVLPAAQPPPESEYFETAATSAMTTRTAAPPAGARTVDEEFSFLEDLLEGSDPGVIARASEQFQESPGLRERYVKQQFVHGLMLSQISMQDRMGRHKRMTKITARLGRDAEPAAVSAIGMTPTTSRGGKRPLVLMIVIGAMALAFAGLMLWLLVPVTLPDTEVIMEKAGQKAFEDTDRTYSVEITMYVKGGRQEFTGEMYVRGAKKVVMDIHTPDGKLVYGTDGVRSWIIPPEGPIFTDSYMKYLNQRTHPYATEVPRLSMEEIMPGRESFNMQVTGKTKLRAHPGRKLVEVRCARLAGKDEIVKDATYWIEEESGLLVQAELTLRQAPGGAGRRDVTVAFSDEQKQIDSFYSLTAHCSGRRIYDPSTDRDRPDEAPGRRTGPSTPGTGGLKPR